MNRRDFLKNAGLTGLCTCFVARTVAQDPTPAPQPAPAEDWRVQFAQQRYSKLLTLLALHLDEQTLSQLLGEIGQFCSEQGFSRQFPGNMDGFLNEMRRRWGADVIFDQDHQTIDITFRPPDGDCACPLLRKGLAPAAACHCSLSALRHSFAHVSKQPTDVTLLGSVLRGDHACKFKVSLRSAEHSPASGK